MATYPLPQWFRTLFHNLNARNHHQFLLDGNLNDVFFWPNSGEDKKVLELFSAPGGQTARVFGKPGQLFPMKEFLVRSLLTRRFNRVFYYSPSTGLLVFQNPPPENTSMLPGLPLYANASQTTESDIRDFLKQGLDTFSQNGVPLNGQQVVDTPLVSLIQIEKALKTRWTNAQHEPVRVATIVDFLDSMVHDARSQAVQQMTERVLRWGLDKGILTAGNVSILLTENRANLPRELQSSNAGTLAISVEFPNSEYRRCFFQHWKETEKVESALKKYLDNVTNLEKITQLTRGFRIIDCEMVHNVSSDLLLTGGPSFFLPQSATPGLELEEYVKQEKKNVIRATSRGLVEPIDSPLTFQEIGGLEGSKAYFKEISKALLEMNTDKKKVEVVPKGVLMAGPPGTGKTLLAKALANESGISIVQMGDIRSMWVGESERNLTMVLDLLKAMAPVIVFIDEVDQAVGQRSSSSGDSGVNGRMFGKILEFMGDNQNRGDVIWIAATNRADMLDDAMLRRFDRIIPVLLPGSKKEWVSVLAGIGRQFRGSVAVDGLEEFVEKNLDKMVKNHSGSSMEMVMRMAYQLAITQNKTKIESSLLQQAFDSFKTNFNQSMYAAQTLISIAACNELSFIQRPSQEYSYGDKATDDLIRAVLEEKANSPIETRIRDLRLSLRS